MSKSPKPVKSPTSVSVRFMPPSQSLRRHDDRVLRFSPLAWLKLRLFLHAGDTEVGFFGIAAEDDLLYVQDLAVPRQTVSAVTVAFEDTSVADHFDACADAGIPPSRCGRLWIHTHPGSSPSPSLVDEETFARVFGSCDWAVMAIVARGGASYARLSFNAGPGGQAIIPLEVDWESFPKELAESEGLLDQLVSEWTSEYQAHVIPAPVQPLHFGASHWDGMDDLYDRHFSADPIGNLLEEILP